MTEPAVGGDGAPSAGSPAATGQTSAASIVAAAERLATEITRNAEAEADAIRARAGSDSDAARAAITDRVRHLSALADGMLERLGEMRAELNALSGALAGAADVREPGAAVAPEPGAGVAPEPGAGVAPESGAAVAPEPGAAADVDDAGARLIALNLALSDTPRDEAARQLRGQVPDPERLVAEVYASVKH